MTIRAKLYTAIVADDHRSARHDRRSAARHVGAGRPLRRGPAERASRGAGSAAEVRRDRHERMADRLRLRRRPLAAALRDLGRGRSRRIPPGRRPRCATAASGRCWRSCGPSSASSWPSTPWPIARSAAGARSGCVRSSWGPRSSASRLWPPPPVAWPATRPAAPSPPSAPSIKARDDARRRLIAVALGAAVVIVLLLVTADDIARMALEGERSAAAAGPPERP